MPAAPAPSAAAFPPTTLDRSEESAITTLYGAAIGPVNTAYYLPIFEHFERAGRAGPSWNRAACLCTLNWLVFRRMWTPALLYAALVAAALLLIEGLGRGVLHLSQSAEWSLLTALALLAFGIPGVWGNALLHRHLRRVMEQAVSSAATLAEARVLLNRQSASRQRLLGIAWANALLLSVLLGLWLAWRASHADFAGTRRGVASAARVQQGSVATISKRSTSEAGNGAEAAAPVARAVAQPALSASAPSARAPVASSVAIAPSASAMAASQTASAPIGPIPRQAATALQHPESVPVPVPAAHSGTQSTTGTTAPERRYYINVGLFADESNARKAYVKLQEAGVVAFTQALDTPSGKRTRVRAGPYASQAQAQVVAEKIRALQLEAVVFRQ